MQLEKALDDGRKIDLLLFMGTMLQDGEPPPECAMCECQLTSQHNVDCVGYDYQQHL